MAPNTSQQIESKPHVRKRGGVGSDFSSPETGFKSQQVSFRKVCFSTFQIQSSYSCILDCRTAFFIHTIGFVTLLNLFTVWLDVCTEKSCYFFFLFSLLDAKMILQVWYHGLHDSPFLISSNAVKKKKKILYKMI